jgi:uncharacterized membrane protein
VPHLSVTVALALTAMDLGVLIYFIHHMATAIQLPAVIASIAHELVRAIDAETAPDRRFPDGSLARGGAPLDGAAPVSGPSAEILLARLDRSGRVVAAPASGYLRFVRHATLVRIAAEHDAVIRLHYRPGHFLTKGHPMATVWPPEASVAVGRRLESVHITGPLRTLRQDIAFGIDQLVEIAIRALSPAVNDTFTALTCIDWLSAGLSRLSARTLVEAFYRDGFGRVRLIESDPSYAKMVNRAFDKIRQAARGMPAVIIRLLHALEVVTEQTTSAPQRLILLRQAGMIFGMAEQSVPDANDLEDIRARYRYLLTLSEEEIEDLNP